MSNTRYQKGRQALLEGKVDWINDNIKAMLVDGAQYTPDLSNDEFLSDVPSGARVSTSPALANKTSTGGVADADDVTFSAVTGPTCEYVIVFVDTGIEGTSRLLVLIDTAVGLPCTPNGQDFLLEWSNAAQRIFAT